VTRKEKTIKDLRADMTALRAVQKDLEKTVKTKKSAPSLLITVKIPDPPIFDGSQKKDYIVWVYKIRGKIAANCNPENQEAILTYILS